MRMLVHRRLLTLLLAVFLGSPSLQASQVPAEVLDAQDLLRYHQAVQAQPLQVRASEEQTLARAFVYLRAGAEGELREEIDHLTEEHPDALRFAMQADCWNPTHFPDGLARAGTWLASFPDRPAAETAQVREIQAFLEQASDRRRRLLEERSSGSWFPIASVLGFALFAFGAFRLLP